MKPARFFLFPCVALVGLSSCGVQSNGSQANLKLPASWKNAGGFPVASPDRDLSRWWGRFNDPTLNRVISISLESSPDIKTATARVREARANRDAAFSSLFPNLTGGASTSSRRNHTENNGTVSSNSYSAGLDASWEVDLFGKNRSGVETAAANLGAAGENLHSVHAALAAEVATVYTTLRT
ncbi:MAG: RND transporter, partial [Verrucomicrobiaceae bacterium]